MNTNGLYIGAAGLLVGLALLLWKTPPQDLLDSTPTSGQPVAYAVLNGTHSRHFDETGLLSYEFTADELAYYRLDESEISPGDFTLLSAPELTLHANERIWYIKALRGRVTDNGAVLTLFDQVEVWQPTGELSLSTSELTVLPKLKLVRTDRAVTIRSPQGLLESVGMSVNLNSQKLQLLNQVRGRHEPI